MIAELIIKTLALSSPFVVMAAYDLGRAHGIESASKIHKATFESLLKHLKRGSY
jgi:hypothetical protein